MSIQRAIWDLEYIEPGVYDPVTFSHWIEVSAKKAARHLTVEDALVIDGAEFLLREDLEHVYNLMRSTGRVDDETIWSDRRERIARRVFGRISHHKVVALAESARTILWEEVLDSGRPWGSVVYTMYILDQADLVNDACILAMQAITGFYPRDFHGFLQDPWRKVLSRFVCGEEDISSFRQDLLRLVEKKPSGFFYVGSTVEQAMRMIC